MRGRGQNSGQAPLQRQENTQAIDNKITEQIPAKELHNRQLASKKLRLPIYETNIRIDDEGNSLGSYDLTAELHTGFTQVRNHLEGGSRGIILADNDGTGKSEFVKEVAALRRAAYVHVPVNTGDEEVPFTLEKDGEVASINVAPQKAELLEKALKEDCVIELEDVDNADFNRVLGKVLQDKSGKVNGKDVTLNDEALVFATFNPSNNDERLFTENQENFLAMPLAREEGMSSRNNESVFKYPSLTRNNVSTEDDSSLREKYNAAYAEKHRVQYDYQLRYNQTGELTDEEFRAVKNLQANFQEAKDKGYGVQVPSDQMLANFLLSANIEGESHNDFPIYTAARALRHCISYKQAPMIEEKDAIIREMFNREDLDVLEKMCNRAREEV